MIKQLTTTALSMMLVVTSLTAAKREAIQTDWRGFQEQVMAQKLEGRCARITVGAKQIHVDVIRATDTALVVRGGREVKQWRSGDKLASIPKEQVTTVKFDGRIGRGRWIGLAVGTGAGAALGGAMASADEIQNSEGPYFILIAAAAVGVVLIGAIVGYFVGNARDRRAPEFALTH